MLNNTFHHIPGIGMKTEQELWAAGVNHWDRLTDPNGLKISPKRLSTLTRYVDESRRRMEEENYNYFEDLLPPALHWRFFPEFRHATAYLDIETTGLEWDYESITTIALYDGENIRHYVKGRNLDEFQKDIRQYKVIVTYNGKCFDVPFIEHQFGIHLDQVHLDLRYILKSLGFKGGLKGCEKSLGIDRGELDGVDGYFAILLWNDYMKNRNPKALETLLAYNIEDVVNLEILMVKAYNMKIQETPFARSNELSLPPAPELPFHPDLATVDRLRRSYY
ncbi:MAG: ribonuclease H-like domain-containing protein [Desulfobacteraceae bacterium]|nr:ribonuclease H-like domain-containing protein [Desulfobacteraceae bacterium]